ncbi:hypothetical protein ACQ4PT_029177 [Festuca glaucescens]
MRWEKGRWRGRPVLGWEAWRWRGQLCRGKGSRREVKEGEFLRKKQENHSDNLTDVAEDNTLVRDEAEDNTVRDEAESPAADNLTGETAAFTGGTCSQQIQQRSPADESVPQQLTQTAEPAVAPPAQQQTHSAHSVHVEAEDDFVRAEPESPVDMEALPQAALRSLASDMGVNLKRAFHHTTSDTMDGGSCVRFDEESSGKSGYKRQKTCYGTLLDEIRATYNMLVETEIRISEEDTGGADGTVIELCYNTVSLTADLSAAICASEITMKLLVPADYPQSSPMILGGDGERRNGVPGVVDMAFRRALGLLPEPRSIEGMAKAWDSIVRRSVVQFAHRLGGGMFTTRRFCSPSDWWASELAAGVLQQGRHGLRRRRAGPEVLVTAATAYAELVLGADADNALLDTIVAVLPSADDALHPAEFLCRLLHADVTVGSSAKRQDVP